MTSARAHGASLPRAPPPGSSASWNQAVVWGRFRGRIRSCGGAEYQRAMLTQRSAAPAVRVAGVIKRFGATVALAGVDLEVAEGTVFGLLGPNGAGKTTLVRVLATLLAPDSGHAEVFGRDVVSEAPAVREMLGLTGPFAPLDALLTPPPHPQSSLRP